MRVFLAGATGVIGVRLVPLLREAGFTVAGLTRSPDKASLLESLGAEAVVGDVFDRDRLIEAVVGFGPDLLMHQLTDLPDDPSLIEDFLGANARIRREGTANLLEAAAAAGVRRFLGQSVAWKLSGEGGASVQQMEEMIVSAGGTVLRYGQLYGPGTYYPSDPPGRPRIHVDDAARRTMETLDFGPGIVELVDPD